MIDFKFSNLKKGEWEQKANKHGIFGCLKSAKIADIAKTISSGDSFICYNNKKEIVMYKIAA